MEKNRGEMILLYNIEDKALQKKYQILCLKMGFRVKLVKPSEYKEPIGALAREKDIPLSGILYEGETFLEPMMVMKIYSQQKLNQFLSGVRKEGIPRIDLKAILTEYNKGWDSFQLYEEIKKEHEAMKAGK